MGFNVQNVPMCLKTMKRKKMTDNIDAHLVDGVNISCKEDDIKSFVDKQNFKVQKVEDKIVEGTECLERSVLSTKKLREKLENVVENNFSTGSIKLAMTALKKKGTMSIVSQLPIFLRSEEK